MNFLRLLIAVGLFLVISGTSKTVKAQEAFSKGVNLSNWFQTSNPKQIQFTKYTKKDFENIKSLGSNVVRLPINLFYMTNGAPDYTVDPLFYGFLDQVVAWADELGIYLIIDNHSTDDIASKNPELETILTTVWKQMAAHYATSSQHVIYEVMNEPNGITTDKWGAIQQKAIDAIRQFDTKHAIMVGGASFNGFRDLEQLPVYTDTNLIYTFHFYDPFIFTHQGATWPSPSLGSLTGVPFPYSSGSMPVFPDVLKGTWMESSFNNYSTEGTEQHLKELIDIVKDFKNTHNVKVYCGEFGVYRSFADTTDRVYWYRVVREYLEQCGIPWTVWDYQGEFGLFKKGSNELFDNDVNIPMVEALGFNIPAQHPFEVKADSVGFPIYSDYIGEKTFESSYPEGGIIDYYSTQQPNNGDYCLNWTGGAQYGAIAFNFTPDKDLSQLVDENYAISFLVRGNAPGIELEVRFIDSKTADPADHPWRMNFTLNETHASWDGYWHPVYIPLSDFVEMGSWDNEAWYDPIGAFDWKAVDRFEITSDQGALTGKSFWFDNIVITNQDTAKVYETSMITSIGEPLETTSKFSPQLLASPNPARDGMTFHYRVPQTGMVEISVFTIDGKKVKELISQQQASGDYSVNWNLCGDNGQRLPHGIYIGQAICNGIKTTTKLIITSH
jgi:endoglucanase